MNIEQLDNFQLTDAINFNSDLNPQLFIDEDMRIPVRRKLLDIAEHFKEFLGVTNIALVDITLSGSNASYSYTPHSDIDLHLIVDFSQLPDNEVYRELFDSKKYQFNDQHDIKIKGYDVELYVQDAAQPHASLGTYSILNDEWNRFPTKQRANLNDEATYLKYKKLEQLAIRALASNNEQYLDDALSLIKRYRRAGLSEKGEFGPENLAFKILRKKGYFRKLWDKKAEHTDFQLSLEDTDGTADVLANEFANFNKPAGHTAESVIRNLYSLNENIFDSYDYETVHNTAELMSGVLEAAYAGNIGMAEMFKFYQKADEGMINVFKRLLSAKKNKEAWQLVQKVTGAKLKGRQFAIEDIDWDQDVNQDMINPLPVVTTGAAFDLMDKVDYSLVAADPTWRKLTGRAAGDAMQNARFKAGTVQEVPISKIVSTEKYLVRDHISALIKGEAKSSSKLPVLYKTGNIYYPGDGNHRIVADYLNKKKTTKALVLDSEKILTEDGRIIKGVNTTADVGVNQTKIEASKLGFDVTIGGVPEIPKNGVPKSLMESLVEEMELMEFNTSPGHLKKAIAKISQKNRPIIGVEIEICLPTVGGDSEVEVPTFEVDTNWADLEEFFEYNTEEDFKALKGKYYQWLYDKIDNVAARKFAQLVNDPMLMAPEKVKMLEDIVLSGTVEDLASDIGINVTYGFEEEDAMEMLRVAQENVKKIGPPETWSTDSELEPYAAMYYNIFVEEKEEAVDYFGFDEIERETLDYSGAYSEGRFFLDTYEDYRELWHDQTDHLHWPGEGMVSNIFDVTTADSLADTMSSRGLKTVVSTGNMERGRDWIIEADTSITPTDGDAGVEIISPPMEYHEGVRNIEEVFAILKEYDAYSNQSTGLHINVSIEGIDFNNLDYAKLVVMLGDNHVLNQFGRQFSQYAASSLDTLENIFNPENSTKNKQDPDAVVAFIQSMKAKLNKSVHTTLSSDAMNFGKFTSVGLKPGYIEFRSVGGADYFNQLDYIKHIIDRFVVTYAIAADEDAYQKEYAKKLYKLASSGQRKSQNPLAKDTLTLFSMFSAGLIDKDTLVNRIKEIRHEKQAGGDDVDKRIAYYVTALAKHYNVDINPMATEFKSGMKEEHYRNPQLKDIPLLKKTFSHMMADLNYYSMDADSLTQQSGTMFRNGAKKLGEKYNLSDANANRLLMNAVRIERNAAGTEKEAIITAYGNLTQSQDYYA